MDLNRNQFFFLGLVVLLIGLQVRFVSSYVLNPKATKFLAERTGQASTADQCVVLRDDQRHRRGAAQDLAAARVAGLVLDVGRRGVGAAQPGAAEAG